MTWIIIQNKMSPDFMLEKSYFTADVTKEFMSNRFSEKESDAYEFKLQREAEYYCKMLRAHAFDCEVEEKVISDCVVVEIECKGKSVVVKHDNGLDAYRVYVDNEDKHSLCSSEDIMRVLAHYAHDDSISGEQPKLNRDAYSSDAEFNKATRDLQRVLGYMVGMDDNQLKIVKYHVDKMRRN